MSFITERAKALSAAVAAVDTLHQTVIGTGPDSNETGTAADTANKVVADAKRYGITNADINAATRIAAQTT
ncbi:hypothetical protein ACH4TX_41725 [Streptomyces sp. NPDC021098]|uniref:hypothetical protein n=1 Tax=unclassified Streptomyces TaxID=2593676 RepID=UPI0037A9936D